MSRKRIWSLKWQTKTKKKKLAIYRSWPWISNCWEWDSNSGLSGIERRALTTRPRRLGANLRRDATSCLLFLNQSLLADFDHRKKKIPDLRLVAFQARVIIYYAGQMRIPSFIKVSIRISIWSTRLISVGLRLAAGRDDLSHAYFILTLRRPVNSLPKSVFFNKNFYP